MYRIILIKYVLKEWIISPLTIYSGKRPFLQAWESKDCDPKQRGYRHVDASKKRVKLSLHKGVMLKHHKCNHISGIYNQDWGEQAIFKNFHDCDSLKRD